MYTQTLTVGHHAYFCQEPLTDGMDTIIPLKVILKHSVVSSLSTARKLGLHPLILNYHQVEAIPGGTNSTALQAEGKLQAGTCSGTPINGIRWNSECPKNTDRALTPSVTHLLAHDWILSTPVLSGSLCSATSHGP